MKQSYRGVSTTELKRCLEKLMEEVYDIRMEIARRENDLPEADKSVTFEKYVTD